MSTLQPGEPSPYAQPQDPWSGATAAPSSTPTDAPPAPAFTPGVATPGLASPGVWSGETVAHNDPYGYVPRQRAGAGTYVLVILIVLLLGGAGGYGAWYLITKNYGGNPTGLPSNTGASHPASATASPSPSVPTFEPANVRVGDCLLNLGSDTAPDMHPTACGTPNSYTVLKIKQGPGIPVGPDGKFSDTATAKPLCSGTGYDSWFGWDSSDDSQDYFFCMKKHSS
jgi:hypothetical protein